MRRITPLICSLAAFFYSPILGQQDLTFETNQSGDQLLLSWPSGGSYLLERAAIDGSLDVWSNEMNNVITERGRQFVGLNPSDGPQFFRLRLDIPNTKLTFGEGAGETSLHLPAPPNPKETDLIVTITEIPDTGTIKKMDGTVVTADTILTVTELLELTFTPRENAQTQAKGNGALQMQDESAGSSLLRYTIDYGDDLVVSVTVEITPVAPRADALIWGYFPQTGLGFFRSDGSNVSLIGNSLMDGTRNFLFPIGVVDDVYYFLSGQKVYGFDGAEITVLLTGFSSPELLIGDRLYYRAGNSETGWELGWTEFDSDPTLVDLPIALENSELLKLQNLDGVLYILAEDDSGETWWKLDENTVAKAILPENENLPIDTTGEVFFYSGEDNELWGFDGINAGLIVDTNLGGPDEMFGFTIPFKDGIVFEANNGTKISNFYFNAQTSQVLTLDGPLIYGLTYHIIDEVLYYIPESKDSPLLMFDGVSVSPVPNQPFSSVGSFLPVGSTIALNHDWIFDGISFSQPPVSEELGGNLAELYFDGIPISVHSEVRDQIFFNLDKGEHRLNSKLVVFNGSDAEVLSDSYGNTGRSDPSAVFLDENGDLLFKGKTGEEEDPVAFFKYADGGLERLSGFDANSIYPQDGVFVYDGKIYTFGDLDGSSQLRRLVTFDGSTVSPASVDDRGPDIDLSASDLLEWNDKLYFIGSDEGEEDRIWSFDGSIYEEVELPNVDADPEGALLTVFKNMLVFVARAPGPGSRRDFYVWDGATDPVNYELYPNQFLGEDPADFFVIGDWLYFTLDDNSNDRSLWQFNGIDEPTMIPISDVGSLDDPQMLNLGGILHFVAETIDDGYQLFRYSLIDGVIQVTEIEGFDPFMLTVVNGVLYGWNEDETASLGLWSYDGENFFPTIFEGTTKRDAQDTRAELLRINDRLIVNSPGQGLYSYDGDSFTQLVEYPTLGYGLVEPFTLGDGRLFIAMDGIVEGVFVGRELWVSDGLSTPTLVGDANQTPIGLEMMTAIENPFADSDGGLTLTGEALDDVLISSTGSDTMRGRGGADRFVFLEGWGMDTIFDFQPVEDRIDLSSTGLSFADLTIDQIGGDTLIDGGSGNTIILKSLDDAHISEYEFLFSD